MSYSLSELNQINQDEFVAALGTVFEDTPAIAQKAWDKRPFADVVALHHSMVEVVKTLTKDEQLALIRAHPDLGSKAKMAEASVQEQAGVGLDRLTNLEYNRFVSLNQAYKHKFGFPFIIAVKNHTKTSILDAFEHRLENTVEAEMEQALTEIAQIAWFRLHAIVT
ncbi:2-oxo-4-hydroxy-4-carboxy-5-ureidoimidazoline decarboxylase [Brasilonema sp. UFV-L1]|uniref:2-oxo-4-hydroxy-4-carboxy-5-ureidoimidazoline decarboxylase n=1 Tax=Brasilonema sp. UFV-L1 TaxID=2234130 RepID=UPI00145F5FCB|nr:2-oxo-4-hydroxy-4-carboxy-5-ureidoimidazoline decarboxylase [Brasilonema sp. UFV-L1]NMG05799.1 2-oxo-4-hydroxy-4-carboxy-5-ureidoimidazoline decarboxylase [Brasilonema sp. UFV-L1]